MSNKIQIKRGLKAQLPTLSVGEPGLTTDTKELFIGHANGNIGIATSEQLADMAQARYGLNANAMINGNFDIWQRGTVKNNPAFGAFLADRYLISYLPDGGNFPSNIAHLRLDLTPSEIPNAKYAYRVNTDGAGSGYTDNASYGIFQRIENGTAYLCGAGKKLTITFLARSSIAGKRIGISLSQRYGSGGSPSDAEPIIGQIINLSAVWTKYKVTINTNTLAGKTLGTNNDDYFQIGFFMLWGASVASSQFGGGTAESFRGAGNIDIAQIQVVAGDADLPFQPRPFSTELALCQRYFQQRSINNASPYDIRPSMRISPTITGSASPYYYDAEL
jgi:hypothetical protein